MSFGHGIRRHDYRAYSGTKYSKLLAYVLTRRKERRSGILRYRASKEPGSRGGGLILGPVSIVSIA